MMDSMTAPPVKTKHLNLPLEAGCSIGHKVGPAINVYGGLVNVTCRALEQQLKKLLNILDLQYGQYNIKIMN